MSPKVAIIFGYGPNVGTAIANTLTQKGYTIATVSRTTKNHDTTKPYLSIQADLSDPTSIQPIFSKVIHQLGPPSVVIYNGKSPIFLLNNTNNCSIRQHNHPIPNAARPNLILPVRQQRKHHIGPYRRPPRHTVLRGPPRHGVGKAGAAHLMHYLAEQYKHKGYRYVDWGGLLGGC
ncbi:NAD dependent epimerase/dehydratase family domain-containing protein [Pochonia chlamydosporia 170]|uniref:NAD dependent epimerase/dehydratase family domain-containing protein n=1 Tax=Pochonia chlamydosporia 170 TaxID=1380566 RepID=A0A179G5J6_METCM|nr:NAD dependent epimerase/dehydratase family domain-containing protein [Pochonia chlamydosporia 170]OAQ73097.1 NAD dependent epimerase/dehydratase family domain-containing protein [Pochonia chlamydosporia 170]